MSLGNGTTVSGLGALNNDGHSIDTNGNVQVDFVWGNVPMQPNDFRDEQPIGNTALYGTNLDFALDNHVIVETGWNGYPLYTPNTTGSQAAGSYVNGIYVPGTVYLQFPAIVGDLTAIAVDNLRDAGYKAANITTAAGATNTSKTVTAASRTLGSTQTSMTIASNPFTTAGQRVTITSVDASVNGTWTVDAASTSGTLVVNTTATTALALTGLTGAAIAVTGTIKAYTLGAGTITTQTEASTITITPWA